MGDNYTDEWHKEAERRKLPNLKTTPEALKALDAEKALGLFEKYNVLSRVELKSRYTIRLEKYIKDIDIEAKALFNIISSQVIPAAVKYQGDLAVSISKAEKVLGSGVDFAAQKSLLKIISELINSIHTSVNDLKSKLDKKNGSHDYQKIADYYCSEIKGSMEEIRKKVDELELHIADDLWPMPKFWEMLFVN